MNATNTKALRRVGRSNAPVQRRNRKAGDLALTQLTGRLLNRLLADSDNPVLRAGLRRAAAEAESLAWLTPTPLLVLPILLEEKAREARLYAVRQAELRVASREWLSLSE